MSMTPLPPSDPLIDVRGLSVELGGRAVLDRVDLSVAPGEIVTLVGPNGAGKTTLVRAVLGLLSGRSGTIRRKPGLRFGYMPQRLAIDATLPLTVRRFLGLWRANGRDLVEAALETAGIAHLADSPVRSVSGGELQRVLLARALLGEPDLLVLDEPDQAVDIPGKADLFARIEAVRKATNCGVLMVSHDLLTVMARTHTVVCLNRRVCCSGPPEDVSRHPDFAQLFGRFAGQLALYQHHHAGGNGDAHGVG